MDKLENSNLSIFNQNSNADRLFSAQVYDLCVCVCVKISYIDK